MSEVDQVVQLKEPSRAALSSPPVTIQRLSGLIATSLTEPSWPRRTTGLAAGSLAPRSHSRAVLSTLPVAEKEFEPEFERNGLTERNNCVLVIG